MNLIYDIRSMLNFLDDMEILFMPRTSNCFADSLAKKGASAEGDFLVWEVD